jgi:hypothetical protein
MDEPPWDPLARPKRLSLVIRGAIRGVGHRHDSVDVFGFELDKGYCHGIRQGTYEVDVSCAAFEVRNCGLDL